MKWKRTKSGQLEMKRQKQQELDKRLELEKQKQEQYVQEYSLTSNETELSPVTSIERDTILQPDIDDQGHKDSTCQETAASIQDVTTPHKLRDLSQLQEKHRQLQLLQDTQEKEHEQSLHLDNDHIRRQSQQNQPYQEPSQEFNEYNVNIIAKQQVETYTRSSGEGRTDVTNTTVVLGVLLPSDFDKSCLACNCDNHSDDNETIPTNENLGDTVMADVSNGSNDAAQLIFPSQTPQTCCENKANGISYYAPENQERIVQEFSRNVSNNIPFNFDEHFPNLSPDSNESMNVSSTESEATSFNSVYSFDFEPQMNSIIFDNAVRFSDPSCSHSSLLCPYNGDISSNSSYCYMSDETFLQTKDLIQNQFSPELPDYNLLPDEAFREVSLNEVHLENLFDNGEIRF